MMPSRSRRVVVSCFLVTLCLVAGSFLLYKAIGPMALVLFLPSWERPAFPMEAVKGLYQNAGEHIRDEGEEEAVTVLCGVDEGPHCYYDWTQVNPDVPRDISRAIVIGINPKEIDRTPDNIAWVRCRRPKTAPDQVQCEVKLWSEWFPIPVE